MTDIVAQIKFFDIIEFIGTFAFAMSGIRLASAKKFDIFGAFVVGFVTAIGGGTIRDLFLGVTPFWMTNPIYLWTTFAALIFVWIFHKQLIRLDLTFFIFDSIGLGLFVVVGVEKTISMGFESWTAITMGMITGAFGGMLRDVLINEIPLIFRKEIYALPCVIAGIFFIMIYNTNSLPLWMNESITAGVVILIRSLAEKYHWQLPVMKGADSVKIK